MAQATGRPTFSSYRTVGEAAAYLGVSPSTLRNWDRSGKLKPKRHPQNGYRIYLHDDLEKVLRSVDATPSLDMALAPAVDWNEIGPAEHFVQFYERDEYLAESVGGFIGAALARGDGAVVIATAAHRRAISKALAALGADLPQAKSAGRAVFIDAAKSLARIMVDGTPCPKRFDEVIGGVIDQVGERASRIHAFGEMVSLLWEDEQRDAAIRLEQLWNGLASQRQFSLFCSYPLSGFDNPAHADAFGEVCGCHARVIPSEGYAALDTAEERMRAIAVLQQKASSLEAEIEHRIQVEKTLSDRERELEDFFENATEGLHKVGPDGIILWANKAECELLGYSVEEYVGQSIERFHADADVIADMLQRLLRGETLNNYPARLRCKNGDVKHVLISSNACFQDGQFAYTRCFTRDVTPQWHAEQALQEASRRKDEFLATLAHELRNPLAPIRNSLELMRTGQPDALDDARDVIQRQVTQMTRLIDDLLDLSRITRDKIELRKERVDLAGVVQSAVETSRPLIESARHRLSISMPETPVYVDADPTRLAQVVANLLNNSAKYTPPGGEIDVSVRTAGRRVVIAVRDNGIGITCEALAYVFDMFRQVDGSLERAQGGLGIGLTLVRRLVELHGGAVDARSDGLGQGSEFTVELPVARAPALQRPSPNSANTAQKLRILVVDDNRDSARTLSMLLQMKGHDVHTAHDGLQAIEAVDRFQPQFILMDVGMPNMNGYDATRQIRTMSAGKTAVIVALTGWGQHEDVQKSLDAGCTAHMVKPVDLAALEQLLRDGCPPAPAH